MSDAVLESRARGRAADGARRIFFLSNDIVYLYRFRGPLMRAFLRDGYEVHGCAPNNDPAYKDEIEAMGVEFTTWQVNKSGRNPVGELRSLIDLHRTIARVQPDVIFSYTIKPVIYGTLIGWIVRVPRKVVMITGLGFAFLPGSGMTRKLVGAVARLGYRLALSKADVAIFQNDDDIALFRSQRLVGGGTDVAKVNGSGVDLEHFAAAPLPDGPPVFLLMARLLRDKGIYEYVEAARIVRKTLGQARFLLLGQQDGSPAGVSEQDLAAWAAEGVVERLPFAADPRPILRQAHIFVLPSYREGTPRATLEALATGRAVISTDVPGCRETVVDQVTGLLVPERDAEALAQAMISLGSDLERAARMGREGRRLCEQRFELGAVVEETVRLIDPRCRQNLPAATQRASA